MELQTNLAPFCRGHLSLALIIVAWPLGCGSHSSSPPDGAADGFHDLGGATGTGGVLGSSSSGGMDIGGGIAPSTGGVIATAGTPSAGGVSGTGGVTATGIGSGGSIGISLDAYPSLTCLDSVASLVASCSASGSCVGQAQWPDSGATMIVSECHSNGIKALRTANAPAVDGTMPFEMTVKKDDSVCYSLSGWVSSASAAVGSFTYKDASGSTILTEQVYESGNATVTCPGGAPTPIDSSSDSPVSGIAGLAPAMDPTCTQGTCSF